MDVKELSGAALAFVGDAVYEIMVREWIVSKGNRPPGVLHKEAVGMVRAQFQSDAVEVLEPLLNEQEAAVYRRGRNEHSGSVPKSCDVVTYRRASGLEALFGHLHLSGQRQRLEELFAHITANR